MKKGVGLITVLVLLSLLVSSCGGGSPSDVVKAFQKAGNEGNYAKAESYLPIHSEMAWQSIMTFGILTVVQIIISILGAIALSTFSFGLWQFAHVVGIIVWLLTVGLWIALMVLTYSGKMWKVPLVGDWAERQASKVS